MFEQHVDEIIINLYAALALAKIYYEADVLNCSLGFNSLLWSAVSVRLCINSVILVPLN
jgi:hypothetical protein